MISIVYLITGLNQLFGAFEHYPSAPEAVATGYLLVNTQSNPIGTFSDPASVMLFEKSKFGVAWGEKFSLKALSHRSAVIAGSFRRWNISAGGSVFGDKLYRETIWGIVTGTKIKKKLILGASVMIYDLKIKQYGSDRTAGLNLGWRAALDDNIHWFGSLRNINAPIIGKSKDSLPQVISSGFLVDPSKKVQFIFEWEQETLNESRIKFGGEFLLMPWISVCAGHATSPNQLTLGINIDYKQIKISYAFSTHNYLDISHWMGVGFSIQR
ncbi:MAG: hypothetical protein ACE5D0_03400 [Fidelibacterota bacterium]